MTKTTLDGSGSPFLVPAGTTQQANDGDELLLLGTIDNAGTLLLNGSGGPFSGPPTLSQLALAVLASPTVTLTGGGTIVLVGTDPANIIGAGATLQTLVNADNTITGTGNIGGSEYAPDAGDTLEPINLVNGAGGVIDANGTIAATPPPAFTPGQSLFVDNGGAVLVNDGLMEATGIGGLIVGSATIDQSGGGTILATGAGVDVSVFGLSSLGGTNLDLIGGTLDATNGGSISFGSFTNLTLDGGGSPITIGAGSDIEIKLTDAAIDLFGTIDNLGTFGGGSPVILYSAAAAMTGGGDLLNPYIFGHGGGLAAFTNAATVSGSGEIGVFNFIYTAPVLDNGMQQFGSAPIALTNLAGGVIDATGTAQSGAEDGGRGGSSGILLFNGGATSINDGLLEATAIGGLDINGGTLDQSGGGTLLASGAGVGVYLQSIDLIGGAIVANNGGIIEFNGGASTITSPGGSLSLSAGAVLEVANLLSPGTLTLQASAIINAGTITDAATLILASPTVALTGGGIVQVTGVLNTSGTGVLVNNDNTISGTGEISSATLSLTNAAHGEIDGVSLDVGGAVHNAGLLENVSVGANIATTIDGAGELLASSAGALVVLYNADIAGGTLAASGGGILQLVALSQAQQGVTLDGRGVPVTIAAGATVQDFANTNSDSGLVLLGSIDLLGTIDGILDIHSGPFAIPTAGVLAGSGTVSGYLANTGTVLARGGTLTVSNDIDGSGRIAIDPGAAFLLGGESGETIDFGGHGNERLVLDTPTAFAGTLANLAIGDRIDLGTNDIQSAIVAGTTLEVTMTDASTLDYALAGLPSGVTFHPLASELEVQCFARGTRIATPDGPRAVESLRVGGAVLTASGGSEKIVWIGRRRIDTRRHPAPMRVWPVRIAAGAFGPDCPRDDLYLSPDHAVFVDDVLIPIKHLINGTSIARMPVDDIVYFHIELDAHHVLLAEGLPVKSWLATGDRSRFDNGGRVIALNPDFSACMWEALGCAPLIVTGPRLNAVRDRLSAEAISGRRRRVSRG